MLIFAIDDEWALLEELHDAIAQVEPNAEIRDFENAVDVLNALERGEKPELVFSDIRMPGMDGLHLAVRIKDKAPLAKIIFVTGYQEYALEAYRRHVNGYLLKPVSAQDIQEELDALRSPPLLQLGTEKLRVKCFGNFEAYWKEKPLKFSRSKTKELLAYLVDREGAWCAGAEIIGILWEDSEECNDPKNYLRVLVTDLSRTLSDIGLQNVLLRRRGALAVDVLKLDCDYYRMLAGDMAALNSYQGQYMIQYSWAELTAGRLSFKTQR